MKNPKDLYIITTAAKRDKLEWEGELAHYLLSPKENYYDNKVVIDSWNNIKKYADVKDAFFLFDEDRVTGYGAWVKNFLKITKSNDWIILSATPGDTWEQYIPVFIANGFYRNNKLDDKMYRESLIKKGKIKYNSKNAENNPECMNVVVLKNRHGERGTCAVKWQGRYSRVVDF